MVQYTPYIPSLPSYKSAQLLNMPRGTIGNITGIKHLRNDNGMLTLGPMSYT
jgi:hypothetical protein